MEVGNNSTDTKTCDFHRTWWVYTNHYSDRSRTGRDIMPSHVGDRCCMEDSHLSRSKKDFMQPIILTCHDFADDVGKQCYLHVYGVRKAMYLMFKESQPKKWLYTTERQAMLSCFQRAGLIDIKDMKLVYKPPFKGACKGPRLMLKLYTSNHVNVRNVKETLQRITIPEMSCIDITTMHDEALAPETRWFIAKRARIVGRVRTAKPVTVTNKTNYYEAYAHHDDIIFDNMEDVDFPYQSVDERNKFYEYIADQYMCPIINEHASIPTKKVIFKHISKAKNIFSAMSSPCAKWTWYEFKKAFLHNIFSWVLKSHTNTSQDNIVHNDGGYREEYLALKSHVKEKGGYKRDEARLVGNIPLSDAVELVFYETLHIAYRVKAALKSYWKNTVLAKNAQEREDYLKPLTLQISGKKRWLVLDIETDYQPHHVKDESIIIISTVVFDHSSSPTVSCKQFYRIPPGMTQDEYIGTSLDCFQRDVTCLIKKLLGRAMKESKEELHELYDVSMVSSEEQLLTQFNDYVCQLRCSFIGYFNGHAFDLPFIANRHNKYKQKKMQSDVSGDTQQQRKLSYTFSYKWDQGYIRYEPSTRKHNHKTFGHDVWASRICSERDKLRGGKCDIRVKKSVFRCPSGSDRDNVCSSGTEGDGDDSDDNVNYTDNKPFASNTQGKCLRSARRIRSILMNQVTLVDVMKFVAENKRCCKLEVAAQKYLGVGKFTDEEVKYENMYKTWLGGNKVKLAAYAMIDAILTQQLIIVKKLNAFYSTLSEIVGLSERETYLEESLRRLISVVNRLGYCDNLLTPDTTIHRDDRFLWVVEHKWKESDYKHLRPPGGSTVPDVFGIYFVPSATLDFKSQYPSIMAGYNVCMTSSIEKGDIERLGLKEEDYMLVKLQNTRPVVRHACAEFNRKCNADVSSTGDPRNCRTDLKYEIVEYDAYFVRESYYQSILNICSREMSAARNSYKSLRDISERKGDWLNCQIYEIYQLVVKTVSNSMYGGSMRIDSIVGDAITNTGRSQARQLALLAESKGMSVMNGDTDSVFIQLIPNPKDCTTFAAMARYFQMNPCDTTVHDVLDKLFSLAKAFTDEVNFGNKELGIGPLYPDPCFLELEKLFPSLCNFRKKNYAGYKLTPELKVSAHRSGMTGKKSDTTTVKSASQFVCIKLLLRRDFPGFFSFIRHMYDFVSWEIYHQDTQNARVQALCQRIDEADMNCETAMKAREEITEVIEKEKRRQESGTYHIPLKWLISHERVGEVDDPKPKTVATKRAIDMCKYMGVERHNAPMFMEVCRNSSVQVTAGLLTILNTFLCAPQNKVQESRSTRRHRSCHSQEHHKKYVQSKQAMADRLARAANETCKLNVTAMPQRWRVQPEMKYCPTEEERYVAEKLKEYMDSL